MGAAAAEADRTLFVGNLDPRVTEELIFELFHQAGPVIKVKIPKDKDGRPKQFAFVNFKHEESVPYGLSLLNGIKLYGRPIKIQFRSGSSHASQDSNPSCPPHGATGTNLSGAPHPSSNCSSVGVAVSVALEGFWRVPQTHPPLFLFSPQMHGAMRQFGGKYEQPGFALPGYQHTPHAMPRRPEVPALRKGRLNAHPYQPDSRHFAREPRFGERASDYCRAKREEYSFEERGHEAEHHYRGELAYGDRQRDGWSHDYDYRREGYREAKWHPSRH
ncbi:RBM7 protein, partial [Podargus strigoides]|nr:RBM7 protein [Podargus strigoides]